MSEARKTTDHDTIRKWVESRGGYPATVPAAVHRRVIRAATTAILSTLA